MEEKKFPKNLIMVEAEITKIFEKRSEKAPVNFNFKIVETREIERNGIKEDVKRTTYRKGTSFDFPEGIVVGDIVQMYGSLRTDHYNDRDGNSVYKDREYYNKFTKVGHNDAKDEVIPDDIPEGEIDLSEIPF